jgi:bacterioferritin-associated ferredoxin
VCLNKECKVAYFGSNEKVMLINSDLKMEIWFKEGANPKYICYCSKVTEEEITEAVVKQGARTVKDVVNITGAMKDSNCKINNPLGKCCSSEIQKVINSIIENKDLMG